MKNVLKIIEKKNLISELIKKDAVSHTKEIYTNCFIYTVYLNDWFQIVFNQLWCS